MEENHSQTGDHGGSDRQARIGPVQDRVDARVTVGVEAAAQVVDDAEEEVGDSEAERVDDVVEAAWSAVDEEVPEGVERRQKVEVDVLVRNSIWKTVAVWVRIFARAFSVKKTLSAIVQCF